MNLNVSTVKKDTLATLNKTYNLISPYAARVDFRMNDTTVNPIIPGL